MGGILWGFRIARAKWVADLCGIGGSPYPTPTRLPPTPVPYLSTVCFVLACGMMGVALFPSDYPALIDNLHLALFFASQAGLRTLHGLGPQLRRAISGQLGSDDDELFLKEDASQKAQVNHMYMNNSALIFF